MIIRCFTVAVLVLAMAVPATAAPSAPCKTLRIIAEVDRKALRQMNDDRIQELEARARNNKKAQAVFDANEWPVTPDQAETGTYHFKPADFDGDGRKDQLKAMCGAGSWNRICFLLLDRSAPEPLELESGWMFVTRVAGRFYVIHNYFGPEADVNYGGPAADHSEYWRITSKGFVEICKPT